MNLPTEQEIEAMHHKYAPTDAVFDLVYTHCKAVWDVAEQLITSRNLTLNKELVKVGCLLHDIGVYPLFDEHGIERADMHYITHGIRGEAILHAEGMPEAICRIASHHTGAGLSKEDIEKQHLPLPVQDYLAETTEERLVMYADKFHSKSNPPHFNSFEFYRTYALKFGKDKVAAFELLARQFGAPDLQALAKKYGHDIR